MSEMTERLEVSVAKLEVQVERLESDVHEMKSDIKAIRATLDAASGGWKVFLMVGGLSAALGGLVVKMLSVWPFGK